MSDELVDLHLAHLRDLGRSKRTIEARSSVLRMLSRYLPYGLAFAATEHIEAWLGEVRTRGSSRWTARCYLTHIQRFFWWACRAGFLDGDPAAEIERIRAPRLLPNPVGEAELAAILALPEPVLTAVILAAFGGLRRFEIAACRREDVSPTVLIIPHGKGDEAGSVPTHPYLWAHVRDRPPGHLVLGAHGRPVSPHWIGIMARRAFDSLGLFDVHLHRLRHRYGTVIQEMYGDLRLTQECMRHRSPTSTMGYTEVTAGRRNLAVASIPVPRQLKTGVPAS